MLTVCTALTMFFSSFLNRRPFQMSHQSLENCKRNFLAWKKERQTLCLRNN